MKITFWGINYGPELTGIAPFNKVLCEFLSARGHDVEMVTAFPYYPEWKKRAADQGKVFRSDEENNVRIERCWLYVPGNLSAWKRILHEASFVATSLLRVLSLKGPDLYVVVSPPLLLGLAAWFAGLMKRAPFALHVQDLQPDAAIGLGMLQKGWLTRLLYWMETFAYSKAARVSGISNGMLGMFRQKGVSEDKIIYFPNGVQLNGAFPASGVFRARHNIAADNFVVLYSGNLGIKQGLDVLVEAAWQLRDGTQEIGSSVGPVFCVQRFIQIVIAGDGARKAHLAGLIRHFELNNVLLLPLQPEEEYREMLRDADCCVITQQQGTGAFFFPSKLLASLAAAKPIVTVADEDSELARASSAARFGINVAPNQPESLARAIRLLASCSREHPANQSLRSSVTSEPQSSFSLAEMGEAGLRFVQQFELQKVLVNFEKQLLTLWNQEPCGRAQSAGQSQSGSK